MYRTASMMYSIGFLALFSGCAGDVDSDPKADSHEPADVVTLLAEGEWIDLTHSLSESTPFWPTAREFEKSTVFEGHTDGGWYYTAYDISVSEHGGTHLDAPVHFAEGRHATDQIPLTRLIGAAAVIDVSETVGDDADYQLSVGDIEAWEQANGSLGPNSVVLVATGWSRFYPDRESYMGTAERGEMAVPKLHFPGIHPDAATLLAERNIKAIGIDTPSIDFGQSSDFKTHQILYERNIPGFENVANLDQLPATGALVVALPTKIEGGSGGPLRIVAWTGPNR